MTFSLRFNAKNKEVAIKKLGDTASPIFIGVPGSVKEFIYEALQNREDTKEDQVFTISASGHLCDGPNSFNDSNVTIDIHTEHYIGV